MVGGHGDDHRLAPGRAGSLVARKSLTSRLRSPIRPTTITSASAPAIIWPISTDLPTPEPATIATRWPMPAVSSALTARTPMSNVSVTRARSSGLPGRPASGQCSAVAIGPSPSSGAPIASTTRPSRAGPTSAHAAGGVGLDPGAAGMGGVRRRAPSAGCAGRGSRPLRARGAAVRRRSRARPAPTGAGEAGRFHHQAVIGGEPADLARAAARAGRDPGQHRRARFGACSFAALPSGRARRAAARAGPRGRPRSSHGRSRARSRRGPERRVGNQRDRYPRRFEMDDVVGVGAQARRLDLVGDQRGGRLGAGDEQIGVDVAGADDLRAPAGRPPRRAARRARWRAPAAASASDSASRATASRSAANSSSAVARPSSQPRAKARRWTRFALARRSTGASSLPREARSTPRGRERRMRRARGRSCRGWRCGPDPRGDQSLDIIVAPAGEHERAGIGEAPRDREHFLLRFEHLGEAQRAALGHLVADRIGGAARTCSRASSRAASRRRP